MEKVNRKNNIVYTGAMKMENGKLEKYEEVGKSSNHPLIYCFN